MANDNAGLKPKRKQGGKGKQIQPGQVLNPKGRPPGSRNKLSQDFIDAISEDFEKHGKAAIQTMRSEKPDAYVRVVADLVPKDINLTHNATDAFVGLWKAMQGKAKSE